MVTEELKRKKTFKHLSCDCLKVVYSEKILDVCPKCNKSFVDVEEQFEYNPEASEPRITYMYFCDNCQKNFDIEQKMDNCPHCEKPFKRAYKHFIYPSKASHIYYHYCKKCKIQYDSDKEIQACPLCSQFPESFGLAAIRDHIRPKISKVFIRLIGAFVLWAIFLIPNLIKKFLKHT